MPDLQTGKSDAFEVSLTLWMKCLVQTPWICIKVLNGTKHETNSNN